MRKARAAFPRALWLCLLVLGGCATTPSQTVPGTGDATQGEMVAPGTVRYQLAMGEIASGAGLRASAAPKYPEYVLLACPPPVEITASLIVDTNGKVSEVRVDGDAGADAQRHRFIDAVRVAALQWRFEPLQVDHWAADANGDGHLVDQVSRPFCLTYVFRFECVAGRPVVSTHAQGT